MVKWDFSLLFAISIEECVSMQERSRSTDVEPLCLDGDHDQVQSSNGTLNTRDSAQLETKMVERIFPIRLHSLSQREPYREQLTSIEKPTIDLEIPTTKSDHDVSAPMVAVLSPPATTSSDSIAQPYISDTIEVPQRAEGELSKESSANQTIYRCEDEPIHIPGAVQAYGALIALRDDAGVFAVRVVSENTQSIVGLDRSMLFGLRCFTDLLVSPEKINFAIRVRAIVLRQEIHGNSLSDVFTISLTSLTGAPLPLYCAMHVEPSSGLVICEFEREEAIYNSGRSAAGLPAHPVGITGHKATDSETKRSTTSKSEPLHTLQVARQLSQPLTHMSLFNLQAEIQEQFVKCDEVSTLLDVVVGLVHDLTGFHRVMLYQFDETAAGCVVSEIVDTGASTDIYRGLHFPAADIPQQARDLYLKNTIRVLYDRSQETAQLVCRTIEDAKVPVNLQHSYLRAMSPIHLRYLANMGVQASMSISIIVDGILWGLIACHNYGAEGAMRMSLPIREVCRNIGHVASSTIDKLLLSARIRARKALLTPTNNRLPLNYIASSTSELLSIFSAELGFLVIRNEARTLGKLLAYNESVSLLQYIRHKAFKRLFCTNALGRDCPDLSHRLATISGILVIPLAESGTDFLIFLRKGQLKEINWAGNPHEEKKIAPGNSYLEPRSSFRRWTETVVGTSREWSEDEIEIATMLGTLYGRFIEIWRQKEAVVQRNRMTRLLIRNAGHEVRTPLNSVINYLEVALEEELDEKARNSLQQSLQTSKSLVSMVDNLLNLTEAEDSALTVHEENVNLIDIVTGAVEAFTEEASRRNLQIKVTMGPTTPEVMRSDPSGLRQVVSNLLANAIQHSTSSDIIVNLDHVISTNIEASIRISIIDQGIGLSEDQLDSIFKDFEQILDDDDLRDTTKAAKPPDRPFGVNLGLATTARFVRRLAGEIKISSKGLGHGTFVSISLPYKEPDNDRVSGILKSRSTSATIESHLVPEIIPMSTTSSVVSTFSGISPLASADFISPTSTPGSSVGHFPFPTIAQADLQRPLRILVAEDNPLNSKLLETRLKRSGHIVAVAVNGLACFNVFEREPHIYDVILMDIQMPILSGIGATQKIRDFEKDVEKGFPLSQNVARYGRTPIIAVSASISEQSVDEYIAAGFDGWIMKPIDYKRLEAIMTAIEDRQLRTVLLYSPGHWANGGWFRTQGNEIGAYAP